MARALTPLNRSQTRSDSHRAPAWALTVICIGAVVCAGLFGLAIAGADTEMLNGLTVAVLLVGATVPIAFHIARADRDATLVGIVMAAAVAKMLGALLRYYVSFEVYSRSDALQYHLVAQDLAPNFREGIFDPGLGAISGTTFIEVVNGIVYAIFGMSRVTGFVVFAWLGFVGLVLITRAFHLAIPEGDSRRYLIVVLFWPSLVYWPASIGKEAWTMLGIGLCAYGVAAILRNRTVGYVSLVLGLLACGFVRPHVSLIVFLGLVLALLVRRAPARSYAAPMFRFLGLIAVLIVGVMLAGQTASFLGQKSLTNEGFLTPEVVDTTRDYFEEQTADGGSEFAPVVVRTPLDLAPAFVTVFFRPFPFEAGNAQGLLTAAECILLFVLLAASWRRIRSVPRLIRDRPYIAFCFGFVLSFVYAFSAFSNFGILARQRVQALPFLLVLLALPDYRTVPRPRRKRGPQRQVPGGRSGRPRNRRPRPVEAPVGAPVDAPA